VLTSRVIDRPIRRSSRRAWRYETQVIALVLSADTETTPTCWQSPARRRRSRCRDSFEKTIAGIRVGLVDDSTLNPTFEHAAQQRSTRLAGSKTAS